MVNNMVMKFLIKVENPCHNNGVASVPIHFVGISLIGFVKFPFTKNILYLDLSALVISPL